MSEPKPLEWRTNHHGITIQSKPEVESAVAWLKQQIKDSAICNNKDDSKSIKIYMNKLIDEAFGLDKKKTKQASQGK